MRGRSDSSKEVLERLIPGDEADRRLIEACHPPGHRNPEVVGRYNLVAIGGGAAGLVSAGGAGLFGGRTALIERVLLGGDCLTTGCVPSKALLRAARAAYDAGESGRYGGGREGQGRPDFGAAMRRMRELRARIAVNDSVATISSRYNVDVWLGGGRFLGRDTIEVGGARLRFRRAVIATGARPKTPSIPGLREAGFHTSETIFTLTEIPQSLIVIGGGPIGCELAQAFRRFGSEVVMLNGDERLLPREDNDVAEIIERQLAGEGMAISHGVRLLRAGTRQSLKQIVFVDKGVEKTVEGEVILVAIGRQPNIEGLGLEAAGVEWNESGVRVDDHLRTTNRRIYAAGDVCSTMMFTHAADAMARIAVRNALFFGHQRMSRLVVPRCTFTDPEVAHVGYSAAEAQADGIEVRTLTAYFSDNDRAILDGEESGMARIHYDRRTDRIIGGTIIARHAGEMIGQLTLAVTSGLKLRNLATTIQPYPTLSESLRRIADNEMLDRMPDLLRRLLRSWLVWNR